MKREDFVKHLKEVNEKLYTHKLVHNHYIIPINQQTDDLLFDTANYELYDFGAAVVQAHYAFIFEKFIKDHTNKSGDEILKNLKLFWKRFQDKKHIKECDICKEVRKNGSDAYEL